MTRSRRLLALFGFWILPAIAGTAQEVPSPPKVLTPEYEITVSDGSRIRKLLRENAWMKDFQASNLFRGSMVRLGPVLYASGAKGSWKGRLVDFLGDRLLDGRPVRISYFHLPGRVSPFGITLPGLSPAEHEAVRLVVNVLRSGQDVSVPLPSGKESVVVTPIALRLQRFAVVETPTCLAVSRDPLLAAVLSRRCVAEARPPAAFVDIDTRQFFSAWSAVLERLFGIGERIRLTFDWDAKRARFAPRGAELTLAKDHRVGSGAADLALLAAIPADTLFFSIVTLPDPGPLSVASVETYFRSAGGGPGTRPVPVSLVYLGMRAGDRGEPEALSALLVPQPKGGDKALADLSALFNRGASHEVHVTNACPGYVALSPSKAALARIADVCAGRQPSFRQVSPKVLAVFTRQALSAGAFWNAGAFLKSALAWGWQRDTPEGSDEDGQPAGRRANQPLPRELADAMNLLERLPMYAFAGRVQGSAVVMIGAEP